MALLWAADRKRFSRLFMRVRFEIAGQSTSATDRKMTLLPELPSPRWMPIMLLLILGLALSLAQPQQFFLAEDLVTGTGSGTGTGTGAGTGAEPLIPVNDPSDLSAGLNLAPVGNLIAAAANAVPPAPVQFIRTAMNSGL